MKRILLLALVAITFSACYRYSPASQPAPMAVAPASNAAVAAAAFNGPAAVANKTFAPTGTVTSQVGDVVEIRGDYLIYNAAKYLAVAPGTPVYLVGNVGGTGWTPGDSRTLGQWQSDGRVAFSISQMMSGKYPVVLRNARYAVNVATPNGVWGRHGANDPLPAGLAQVLADCTGGRTFGLFIDENGQASFSGGPTVAGC